MAQWLHSPRKISESASWRSSHFDRANVIHLDGCRAKVYTITAFSKILNKAHSVIRKGENTSRRDLLRDRSLEDLIAGNAMAYLASVALVRPGPRAYTRPAGSRSGINCHPCWVCRIVTNCWMLELGKPLGIPWKTVTNTSTHSSVPSLKSLSQYMTLNIT